MSIFMLNNWSIFMLSYLKSVNYLNFYKNIIKIFNNENIPCISDNTNIINLNQHPLVRYGQKLISKIENSSYLHIMELEK